MRPIELLKRAVDMGSREKSVDLPNGETFSFFMTPLTMAERSKCKKMVAGDEDEYALGLQLLAYKATDASGNRLFNQGEIAELRNELPSWLVDKIMTKILEEDVAQAKAGDATKSAPAKGTR